MFDVAESGQHLAWQSKYRRSHRLDPALALSASLASGPIRRHNTRHTLGKGKTMKLNPYVLAISAALAMMAPSSGAVAQDAAAPAAQPSPDATATPAAPAAATGPVNAAPAAAAEANKTPGTNWLKVCDPLPSGKKVCIVRQIVVANNKVIGSLIIRQNPDLRSPFLAIGAVPVGVALAPGVSWRIDGGKAVTLPYSQCVNQYSFHGSV